MLIAPAHIWKDHLVVNHGRAPYQCGKPVLNIGNSSPHACRTNDGGAESIESNLWWQLGTYFDMVRRMAWSVNVVRPVGIGLYIGMEVLNTATQLITANYKKVASLNGNSAL
jgi:hypothetical protein